jgi:hypothetical protein
MASHNPTVRRFRTQMLELVNRVGMDFHEETLAQADELIDNMRRTIDHSVTGHLVQSIRKFDATNQDQTKISVLVLAGGPLTTKRTAAGAYDYALAEEFGTTKETPRPFFYSSARFYRHAGIERYRETLDQAIAENNRTREYLNRDNYSDATSLGAPGHTTISFSYRGAVKLQQTKSGLVD